MLIDYASLFQDRNEIGFPKRNKTCQWTKVDTEYFDYCYNSSCEEEFGVESDLECYFTFCPFCSGEIEWI